MRKATPLKIIHDCQILQTIHSVVMHTIKLSPVSSTSWKMTKIYKKSELDQDEPVVCSGKDCKFLAVAKWENVDNQNEEWVACLDCQEK